MMSQKHIDMENPLINRCLDFCRHLESTGTPFYFKLSMGNSFAFVLDTKRNGNKVNSNSNSLSGARKRITPSTARRNAKRKKEFLDKKTFPSAPPVVLNSVKNADLEAKPVYKCDFCDNSFETTKGLNIHERKKHPMTMSPIKQLDGAIDEMMEPEKEHEKWEDDNRLENSNAKTELDKTFREHEKRFTNVIYEQMKEYKKFMESLSPIKQMDMAVDDMNMAFREHDLRVKDAMENFRIEDIPDLYNAILSYAIE